MDRRCAYGAWQRCNNHASGQQNGSGRQAASEHRRGRTKSQRAKCYVHRDIGQSGPQR